MADSVAGSAADRVAIRGIRVERTGEPEVLEMVDLPRVPLETGQVRLKTFAAGVNFIDIYQRSGVYPMALPFVPGSEGAGEVIEIADGVSGLSVGDRVAWESVPGSYAAEVVGAADRLIPVPAGVSDEQAAAAPLQGLTAHYLATSSYAIQPGDAVLIHAGAGGVGLLLTQIAKHLGARVFTTASTDAKKQQSREAGADEVLDYDGFDTAVRGMTAGAGVAAVYDGVGRDTFDRSMASVRRRGTLVLFGGASGQVPPVNPQRLAAAGSIYLTRPTVVDFVAERDELLHRSRELFGWIADGTVTIKIGATYPLVDAARAQDDLAARRTSAKLLLLP